MISRRHRGRTSTCHCPTSSTRWRLGSLAWITRQRLVALRAQALTILAKRLEDVRMHPRFGPDNQETARILDAAEIMQIDIAALGEQQTRAARRQRWQKKACSLVVSGVKTTVVGASQSRSMVVGRSTAAALTTLKRPGKTSRKPSWMAKELPPA